ncbi:MAG: polysaccharide deacetylase family protein [Actinomycetes bacterium]
MSILCYHAIEDAWPSPMAVEPADFTAHCRWLQRRRTVVPLERAVGLLDPKGRLPRGTAALTFDDGFTSLYDEALPVLTRLQLPATVFLVAQTLTGEGRPVDWVDTPPPAPRRLTTLTRDQVREMQDAGVDFQSHSWAHHDLTTLGHAECVRDLRESRELLEELLGRPVRQLAYPRGRHDAAVRDAAEKAGYSHAFALPERSEAVGPFALPRVGIHRGNGTRVMRVKAQPAYLAVRTSPAFPAAARAVRAVRAVRAARRAGSLPRRPTPPGK